MEFNALNHIPGDPNAGDAPLMSSNAGLRDALQKVFESPALQLADGSESRRAELRTSLRHICSDARAAGLRAEQLLVLIKEVWSALPAGIMRIPSVHGDERLNYVITTCVDEYYAHIPGGNEGAP